MITDEHVAAARRVLESYGKLLSERQIREMLEASEAVCGDPAEIRLVARFLDLTRQFKARGHKQIVDLTIDLEKMQVQL